MSPGNQSPKLGEYVPGHPGGTFRSRGAAPSPVCAAKRCGGRTLALGNYFGENNARQPKRHRATKTLSFPEGIQTDTLCALRDGLKVPVFRTNFRLVIPRDKRDDSSPDLPGFTRGRTLLRVIRLDHELLITAP